MKYFSKFVFVLISLVLTGLVEGQTGTGNCTKVSSCKCIFDDGTILDLEPLARQDGQAA